MLFNSNGVGCMWNDTHMRRYTHVPFHNLLQIQIRGHIYVDGFGTCVRGVHWCMVYIRVWYSWFQNVTHMDSSLIYRLLSPLAAGSHSSVNPSSSQRPHTIPYHTIPYLTIHILVPLHSAGACAPNQRTFVRICISIRMSGWRSVEFGWRCHRNENKSRCLTA